MYPARGDKCIMKNRYYLLLAFALFLPFAAVAASTGTVFAQSCGVQVGSMGASTQYSGGNYYGQNNLFNIQLTVPISISCPASGAQLWAVGTAYDTVTNVNLGSNNVMMNWNNGYYSGQLAFIVPSFVVGHQLQVQIQVYNGYINGQYGGLVATSSLTVTINPSSYYPATGSYSYYNGYPNGCYNGYYYYYYGYPSYYPCYSGYSYYHYYYGHHHR